MIKAVRIQLFTAQVLCWASYWVRRVFKWC